MAIEQVVEDLNLHVVPAVQTSYHKKLKSTHAFIGDVILFKRKGFLIQGIVVSYRPESVIVEIDIKDAKKIGIENNITIVNHKNYELK